MAILTSALDTARYEYRRAAAEYVAALAQLSGSVRTGAITEAEQRFDEARAARRRALEEFRRALARFTDLVSHRIIPDDLNEMVDCRWKSDASPDEQVLEITAERVGSVRERRKGRKAR